MPTLDISVTTLDGTTMPAFLAWPEGDQRWPTAVVLGNVGVVQAREVLGVWKHDYNYQRPHGSLGRLTPSEFAMRGQKTDSGASKL